jgi:SAM-dependent methyltransferase
VTGAKSTGTGVPHARSLIDRFLADRGERTAEAYTADLEEFARYRAEPVATAVAALLSEGGPAANRTAFEYAVALARRGRAAATIDRRLSTLRALVRVAVDQGLVTWNLRVPSKAEIWAAVDQSPVSDNPHYLFPRDPSEIDRLDVQHYALRATLGADYLAPIEDPRRVLDAGAGTGQWGFELCQRFPQCLVVGLDLVAGKPDRPAGYRLVRGNLLQGIPFRDDQFDLVHQRLLMAGVPLRSWPGLVEDLARVTRPGGWLELVEFPWEVEDAGPATEHLLELSRRMAVGGGLDPRRVVIDSLESYLRDAGLEAISSRDVALPIGPMGGEVGSLMATDMRAGFTRLCEAMQSRGLLSAEVARDLIQAATEEAQQRLMRLHMKFACGRKPD